MDYKREAARLIARSHIVEQLRQGDGKARWAADSDEVVYNARHRFGGDGGTALLEAMHQITPHVTYTFEDVFGGNGVDLIAITDERAKRDRETPRPYLAIDVFREIWERYGIKTTAMFHIKPDERLTAEQRDDMLSMYEQLSKLHLGGSSDDE